MTVIPFERPSVAGAWSEAELNVVEGALGRLRDGEWDTGLTETGDAQLYLLGPEQACELCVSRIGGRYILEDGAGRLLFEHRSLPLVAMHARSALRITCCLSGCGVKPSSMTICLARHSSLPASLRASASPENVRSSA